MIREDDITLADFSELAAMLDRMVSVLEEPQMTRDRWQVVIEFLEEMERRIFAEERTPDGESWAALSPYTIRKKGHSIKLVEKRLLIESMTQSGAQHAIREVDLAELVFGTNRPWATSHQYGTDDIPQREFAGLGQDDLKGVVDLVADAAVEMMMDIR